MSWSRAVWLERNGKKVVEGVLSSNWIDGDIIWWPRKDAESLAKGHVKPAPGWLSFPLVKVKFQCGMYAGVG